ncbi:unnamed protein product [Colias eurytheme]|nr:unnamed protein product [Colias eurytheme]
MSSFLEMIQWVRLENKNQVKLYQTNVPHLEICIFLQGIRGAITKLPIMSASLQTSRSCAKGPRYQFSKNNEIERKRKLSMGPPAGLPPTVKRKLITSSSKMDSSSSSRIPPRVLASDSAVLDSSFCTPKNRPAAIRYISSSSRAISEGRGMARGEIGMAAIDLRHPNLILCQFSDTLLYTHTMTKINFFNPVEIIVPHTFCEGIQPSQLYQLIKDQYPLINLTAVQRRHFNDATGRQQIQSLCAPQYSAVYLQVLHKFYALTAAAAVLKYVEYIQCIVFARESIKIEYHSSENTMIIDVGTATQLELVQPLVPSAGPTCCLLGVLGPTYTVGGIRALRAAILQPSCKKEFIEARLDAVQELIENDSGIMSGLQDTIKKLSEIDKILLLCIETNQQMDKHGEAQLNQTLLLKTTMDMVPNLVDALKPAESGRLRKIKMDFENPHYNEIAERIRGVLLDDAHLEKGAMGSLQRCFAVKPEINGLLDVARRTYSELIEDIQKIVEQLSETYDLPIRLNQNVMKGFHIVLPVAPKNRRDFNVNDLPAIFIQVHFNGSSVTMTTEELVVLDHQAKEALNEIQKMSNIVISALLKDLRPFMPSLYKLCENVAELDILIALAQFASPEYNFTIITGPNMGGKSIYIKQIAIMQVMAQMKEIQHILKGLTRCSLVIIDELCRGTSVEEGTTIAWAICEELIASEAFTFFTTHFMYLTRLEDLYFNVVNRHTAVAEEDTENSEKRLIYQHKIESGISKIDNYGLALAAKTNLPEETVNLAKELAQLIATRKKPQHYLTDNRCDDRTVYGINAKIAQEKRQNPNINLESVVKKFASENTELVEKLRMQSSNDKTILNTKNTTEGSSVINSDSNSGNNEERAKYDKNVMNSSISNNNEEIVIDKNMNPTSVKFSTELLNTFLNTTDTLDAKNDDSCKSPVCRIDENVRNPGAELELHYSNELRVSNKSMNFDDDDKISVNQQDSSNRIDNSNNLNVNDDILESQSNMNNYIECSSKESETDSDLAEALTQRIEECSSNSKQSSEILSSDEELMEETINEITHEIHFENLVLTPPPAFRDIM